MTGLMMQVGMKQRACLLGAFSKGVASRVIKNFGLNNKKRGEFFMKKHQILPLVARIVIFGSLFTFLVVAFAPAQSGDLHAINGNVPFEFTAGTKVLPAGSYKFTLSRGSGGFFTVIVSSGTAGKIYLPVLTRLSQTWDRDAKLVFDNVDNKHVLSEVWLPGEDGLMLQATSKEHSHQTVLVSVSAPSAKLPGNKIYEQTCQKCHGPKGQGNPAADKFFQVAIPRLASEAVMAKSDQELKDIITHGRRNMPPVRIGEATVQHLLQPEAVDAVVSFLRTFKQ